MLEGKSQDLGFLPSPLPEDDSDPRPSTSEDYLEPRPSTSEDDTDPRPSTSGSEYDTDPRPVSRYIHISICPLEGCGRLVKRLWNHLENHKKRGDILPPQHHKKRSRWSQEEERVLRDEIEIVAHQRVPSRKTCQGIIDRHREVFQNRSMVEIQDKYRRMIRKVE